MATKTYILDTNVLIHDPESIFKFQDNIVILPFTVIDELDGLKKGAESQSLLSEVFFGSHGMPRSPQLPVWSQSLLSEVFFGSNHHFKIA